MRKLMSAGIPARQLSAVCRRRGEHGLDEFPGDGGGRRAGRDAADPSFGDELADAGYVIAHDRAAHADGFHHPHWMRLIVRQGGNDAIAQAVSASV